MSSSVSVSPYLDLLGARQGAIHAKKELKKEKKILPHHEGVQIDKELSNCFAQQPCRACAHT